MIYKHPTTRSITQLITILISVLFLATSSSIGGNTRTTLATSNTPVIILSSESKPYQSAAQACTTSLKATGHKPRVVLLKSLSDQDFNSMNGSVVAIGARAARSALNKLPQTTKLYYCMVPSPDTIGLTTRPNTAGISSDADPAEEIRIINTASSSFTTLGMFYNSDSTNSVNRLQRYKDAIPSSIKLVTVDLKNYSSVSDAINELIDQDIDMIWTAPDPTVYNSAMVKSLLIESLKKRVPVFGFSLSIVRAGSTFGFGIQPETQGTRLASLVENNTTDEHVHPELTIAINTVVASRINFRFNNAILDQAEITFGDE